MPGEMTQQQPQAQSQAQPQQPQQGGGGGGGMPQMTEEGLWMLSQIALRSAAKLGRDGDDHIVHAGTKDVVIPAERRKGAFEKELKALMDKHKIPLDEFTVGSKKNKINPNTQLPEFRDDGREGSSDGGGGGGGGGGASGGGGGGGASAVDHSQEGGRMEGGAGASTGGPGTGAASGDGTAGSGGGATAADAAPGSGVPMGGEIGLKGPGQAAGYATSSIGSGMMGGFGQPTSGIGFVDKGINAFTNDPIGTLAGLGVDMGLGLLGPMGLGLGLLSRGVTGNSFGTNAVNLVEGGSVPTSGPIGKLVGGLDAGGGSAVGPSKAGASFGGSGAGVDSNSLDRLVRLAA